MRAYPAGKTRVNVVKGLVLACAGEYVSMLHCRPNSKRTSCKENSDGDRTWDLVQQRTCNPVNEITNISTSVGPAWAAPQYDRNGNMTLIPKPADPTQTFTATYDPWNRLVKLADTATSNPVAEYSYDTRNRRIIKRTYDDAGSLAEVRHLFVGQGRYIEERVTYRVGSSIPVQHANPDRQFIMSASAIAVLLRYRDADGDGKLEESLFPIGQNSHAPWTLCDTLGRTLQRYAFTPPGTPECLSSGFEPGADTLDWRRISHMETTLMQESRLYSRDGLCWHPSIGTLVSRQSPAPRFTRIAPSGLLGPVRSLLAGKSGCAKYMKCCLKGDKYACGAFFICVGTPSDRWSNCVRSCLLARYSCFDSLTEVAADHVACWMECISKIRPPCIPEIPVPRMPPIEIPIWRWPTSLLSVSLPLSFDGQSKPRRLSFIVTAGSGVRETFLYWSHASRLPEVMESEEWTAHLYRLR